MYAACWRARRIPAQWKISYVHLIPKSGNLRSPANRRSICLRQALYKLYSGILARKFSQLGQKQRPTNFQSEGFQAGAECLYVVREGSGDGTCGCSCHGHAMVVLVV
ncbi:TPA: hypothetical protein N0F65_006058 [Lagenidium giganteum]|uniref:Uncharacterized protein n=1 Tax=Lagenidium giganteum TaxID=4803 RepID=A0AAV2YLP2_9STRA|nr:TPA: hypothetical protein N0F65_006058 [Lagenidium giganteum]